MHVRMSASGEQHYMVDGTLYLWQNIYTECLTKGKCGRVGSARNRESQWCEALVFVRQDIAF